MANPAARKASFSLPSILALICAIAGFSVESAGGALLLCIAAGLLGALGVVLALLPGVRGGLVSVASIVMGLIGVVVAIVRLLTPG